jgi:DedD protein
MDRRVKERLIGASILVALIVLVVPELLSGPKPAAGPPAATLPAATPEPIRNVTVDLSTSKPAANPDADAAVASPASAAIAAPADHDANPPGSATSPTLPNPSPHAASNPAPASAAGAANPPIRPAAVESPARSPISQARAWSVQLGSFASRANADNLTRQLKGQGFSVFVAPGGSGSNVRYRVRVGPLADRESAERMAAKLKTLGHVSSLVSPAG